MVGRLGSLLSKHQRNPHMWAMYPIPQAEGLIGDLIGRIFQYLRK